MPVIEKTRMPYCFKGTETALLDKTYSCVHLQKVQRVSEAGDDVVDSPFRCFHNLCLYLIPRHLNKRSVTHTGIYSGSA